MSDVHIYNYDKFMAQKPTHLGTVYGEVEVYEHPVYGDEAPVIGVSHKHRLAFNTGFYDPDTDQGDAEMILEIYQELVEEATS